MPIGRIAMLLIYAWNAATLASRSYGTLNQYGIMTKTMNMEDAEAVMNCFIRGSMPILCVRIPAFALAAAGLMLPKWYIQTRQDILIRTKRTIGIAVVVVMKFAYMKSTM